jgi:ABC-type nitrate/sulfonate/bicarbonate transport system substrate-binding protein
MNIAQRRIMGAIVGVSVGALLLSGCGGDAPGKAEAGGQDGSNRTTVSIGLLEEGMTTLPPKRLADDSVLQEKYGIDVKLKYYPKPEMSPAMAMGAVDATIAAPSNMAALAGQGAKIQVVGTVSPDDSIVLLGMGDKITSADQLRGKRVTTLSSSGTWRTFEAQVEDKFGLVAGKDYEVVNVDNLTSGAAQIVANTADYAFAWEPFATQSMKLSPDLHPVLDPSSLKDYVGWQFIAATQSNVSQETKANLIGALSEAAQWLEDNPAEADEKYGDSLGYDPGVIESVLNAGLLSFDIGPLSSEDEESILADLGLIDDLTLPDRSSFFARYK